MTATASPPRATAQEAKPEQVARAIEAACAALYAVFIAGRVADARQVVTSEQMARDTESVWATAAVRAAARARVQLKGANIVREYFPEPSVSDQA